MRSLRFALLLAALTALPARCAELVVGAPRELAECVDALSAAFLAGEKDLRLRFVMDTNEKLYEKVSAGAPLDVYMSSHMALQGQLLADGKMVYDSWTMYATGRIVLWSLDKRIEVGKGIELLSNPALKLATVNGGNPYARGRNCRPRCGRDAAWQAESRSISLCPLSENRQGTGDLDAQGFHEASFGSRQCTVDAHSSYRSASTTKVKAGEGWRRPG